MSINENIGLFHVYKYWMAHGKKTMVPIDRHELGLGAMGHVYI